MSERPFIEQAVALAEDPRPDRQSGSARRVTDGDRCPVAARRCLDCGRDRVEINRDRDGVWLCLTHYLARHPEQTVASPAAARRQPRARDSRTDWQRFRDVVIDALWDHEAMAWSIGFRSHERDGDPPAGWDGTFRGYIDHDRFVGTCPVCGAAVVVRFAGTAARAALTCLGVADGCPEDKIVARIPGLRVRLR